MYLSTLEFVRFYGINDALAIIGLVLAIGGALQARSAALGSKDAAIRAEEAANAAARELMRIESFIDLTTVISAIEEIKTLHRQEAWELLLDRYAASRKLLIAVRTRIPNLQDRDILVIDKCISNFSTLESRLESKKKNEQKINIGNVNKTLSKDIDGLVVILNSLRNSKEFTNVK